ncbi:hypothetical protein L6R52_41260, partial [Myxococcota bacterium]|nr:hypothetical protein [Myxococcota bacterium]
MAAAVHDRGLRARTSAGVAALAFVASSCALSADVLELPTEGARSALLVFVPEDPAAAPEVRALALTDAAATIAWPVAPSRDGALFVLRYECPLDALALQAGVLDLSTGTGRPLPRTDDVVVTDVARGVASSPRAGTVDAPALARVSLVDAASREACLDVDVVSFVVPDSGLDAVEAMIALPGDAVLAVTSRRRFFRASAAGGIEALPQIPATTPGHGGVVDDAGELWLFGDDGETVHGTIEGGFVPGPPMPVAPSCMRTARSPRGEPYEVFVVGCEPVVLRFDGTAWTLIDRTEAPATTLRQIAWIGPGAALALGPDLPAVSGYIGDWQRAEVLPISGSDGPRSVARSTHFGVLVGTEGGNMLRRDD